MNCKYRIFLILVSAFLFSLAIPNELFYYGSWIIGFFALVPLYISFDSTVSWSLAGFLGGLFMFTVHLLSSFWLAYFKEFAIFTLGASALATFVMGIPVGWALKKLYSYKSCYRPIFFACIWTIWEWLKSTGFLAYPWGTIFMSLSSLQNIIQIVDITGVWGLSFVVSFSTAYNAEIIQAISKKQWKTALYFLTIVSIFLSTIFFYGFIQLHRLPSKIDTMHLLLVQQNEDSWASNDYTQSLLTSQKLTRQGITHNQEPFDLIVWSESILPYTYNNNRLWFTFYPKEDPFIFFLNDIQTPLLTGGPFLVDEKNQKMSNSVFLLNSDGSINSWYAKMHLVPFAEYMPLTEYPFVRNFFNKLVGFSSGWTPGTKKVTIPIQLSSGRTISFIAPICFEDAFPSLVAALKREGADAIINLTNDSWSKTNSAEIQHSVLASFRAIELRCPLIRSTNGGHTVVYDQDGKIIEELPLFIASTLATTVPIYPRSLSFYAQFDDWFPKYLIILCISIMLFSFFSKKRRLF